MKRPFKQYLGHTNCERQKELVIVKSRIDHFTLFNLTQCARVGTKKRKEVHWNCFTTVYSLHFISITPFTLSVPHCNGMRTHSIPTYIK